MSTDLDFEWRLRNAAIDKIEEIKNEFGEVIHVGELMNLKNSQGGFHLDSSRVSFFNVQRGIFKPAIAPSAALSIMTAPPRAGQPAPYDDEYDTESGFLVYKYRGTDPMHPDNVALRQAYELQLPLIYFLGIDKGLYMPIYPAVIVEDDPKNLEVKVQFPGSNMRRIEEVREFLHAEETIRSYRTYSVKRRLHQKSFRHQVLSAYKRRCAICGLNIESLLDASHIIPDSHEDGISIVPNGLSLCNIHHRAFDSNIIGINPELRVEVRSDILDQSDGPMLEHGIKRFNDHPLSVPRVQSKRPERRRIEYRYEEFLSS